MISNEEKQILQFLISKQVLTTNQAQQIFLDLKHLRSSGQQIDLIFFLQQKHYISHQQAQTLHSMKKKSTRITQNSVETAAVSSDSLPAMQNSDMTVVSSDSLPAMQNSDMTVVSSDSLPAMQNSDMTVAPPVSSPHFTQSQVNVYPETRRLVKNANSQIEQIAHYRIKKELGRGGMGVVYLAQDEKLDREVALKLIINQESISETQKIRFMREARATAKLKHPNIVEVYEADEIPVYYFTMEFIKGKPLSDFIRQDTLKYKEIAEIMHKCADAIAVAHTKKIIHRDIKPSNIMMDGLEPKIMDFGLAKEMQGDDGLSKEGDMMGTLSYMAPEQADNKEVGPHSDVYSLGATLYHALTGRVPFQGDSYFQVLKQMYSDDPIPPRQLNPDIPKDLQAICLKCLAKKPQNRYRSARELAKDFDRYLKGHPILAKPAGRITRILKWGKRNKVATLVMTLFLCFALTTLFFSMKIYEQKEKISSNNIKLVKQSKKIREKNTQIDTYNKELINKLIDSIIAQKKSVNIQYKLTTLATENLAKERKIEKIKKFMDDFTIEENEYSKDLLEIQKANKTNEYFLEILRKKDMSLYLKFIGASQTQDTFRIHKGWEWEWLKARKIKNKSKLHKLPVAAIVLDRNTDAFIAGDSQGNIFTIDRAANISQPWKNSYPKRDDNIIDDLAISPSGKILAVVGENNTLIVWNIRTKKIKKIKISHHAKTCNFIDERRIVIGFDLKDAKNKSPGYDPDRYKRDKRMANLCILNIQSGQVKKYYLYKNKKQGDEYARAVLAVGVPPDNSYMVVGRENPHLALMKINLKTHKEEILKKGSKIHRIVFSRDNRYMVTVGEENDKNEIIVWNTKEKEQTSKLGGHQGSVKDCCISFNNQYLATAGKDGKIILWDLKIQEQLGQLSFTSDELNRIAFSADDKELMVVSRDGTFSFFQVNDLLNPQKSFIKDKVHQIIFPSNNNHQLLFTAGANSVLHVWDKGKKIEKIAYPHVEKLAFNKSGNLLVIAARKSIKFHRYSSEKRFNIIAEAVIHAPKHQGFTSCSFGNENLLALGRRNGIVSLYDISNVNKPAVQKDFFANKDKVLFCRLSPNNKKLLAIKDYDDYSYLVFTHTQNGEVIKYNPVLRLENNEIIRQDVLYACFSSDSRYIAVCLQASKSNLRILNAETLEEIAYLDDHVDTVTCCNFSPDGKRLVSGSLDKTLRIWDLEALEHRNSQNQILHISALFALREHQSGITSCIFSPDGTKIASSATGEVFLWDTKN